VAIERFEDVSLTLGLGIIGFAVKSVIQLVIQV
jgi:hypothetical protein